jgi:hypothetical protein
VTQPSESLDGPSKVIPSVVGEALVGQALVGVPADGAVADVRSHLGSLAELDQLPLAEHAEHFQQIHVELQRVLAEIDTAEPGTPAP